jgi:hypothetical protein
MPFEVKGRVDDHTVTVTAETAKEAFAKAVEWHVVDGFTDITISDGIKTSSIAEFSSRMELSEIASTDGGHRRAGTKAKQVVESNILPLGLISLRFFFISLGFRKRTPT